MIARCAMNLRHSKNYVYLPLNAVMLNARNTTKTNTQNCLYFYLKHSVTMNRTVYV